MRESATSTGYLVVLAHTVEPDGPWDGQAVTDSGFAAGFGPAVSVVTALLTLWFVKAEWARRCWFALAAAPAAAAVLRLTLLAPTL
ncbi:hypothetical protein EAO71_28080 [Streptomyces sp. ms191]|uniref:hypothetical protein n=1 Tax=unclassified Streptomyces TaxID=2593676 RepID=UPI0011CD93EF|nr:hypothetical protein [Streptomyces sp. ms191]TXS21550.1 hypothetical protein EAO71_28080 [Streptomyces sp. ms191]